MQLNDDQIRICKQVINVFETGKPEGNYSAVTVMNDGPNNTPQVTYGRSQTTEHSNLKTLSLNYVNNKNAKYSGELKPYLEKICKGSLSSDEDFKELLKSRTRCRDEKRTRQTV
ncbi:malQ [Acrasis kona]|uniref:MalQ n=1 Tax=Acrasis kona TaxID=1008807 RepID=A0AAW2YUB9_9EUKA